VNNLLFVICFLVAALPHYAVHLSLPAGVESPLEIFPTNIVHQLNLELCLDHLSGLGQEEGLTLEKEDQQDRRKCFIESLREREVYYF